MPHEVFVPGLGLNGDSSRRLRARLGGARVLTLPGYGERAAWSADLSPVSLASRLVASLPEGPVVLVGHSASCQVVAEAAALAPSTICGLVLVGPTTDRRSSTWRRLVARWLSTARHEPPRLAPSLVSQYARTGLGSMARALDAARRHDIRTALGSVTAPVTVVRGDRDRIVTASWADELAGLVNGSVVTVRGGAHMVVMTHPSLVAQAIQRRLTRGARSADAS